MRLTRRRLPPLWRPSRSLQSSRLPNLWTPSPSLIQQLRAQSVRAKITRTSVSDHPGAWRPMEVRPVAVCRAVSVSVVSVRLPVVCPHHPRLVRALFVAHMSIAHSRVHSQNSGCGDRAPRHRSATRTRGGLIARRHRLPILKIATAVTSVGVERHACSCPDGGLMPDHPSVPRISPCGASHR